MSNTHACFFPLQTFQAKRRSQHREALSLLPSSRPHPPCWAISAAAQPCSYCWGKQKTTAMWHQTGLHHVYAMTEAWAQPQRGRATAAAQTDSASASKAVLQRQREQEGLGGHGLQLAHFIRRPRDRAGFGRGRAEYWDLLWET